LGAAFTSGSSNGERSGEDEHCSQVTTFGRGEVNLSKVRKNDGRQLVRVFRFPVFVGLLLSSGLLSALLSEGLGRYFSWIALSLPVFVCLWAYFRRFRLGQKFQLK
jgi:hypothetical protein